MAYEIIARHKIHEWEQEEITETNLVAGDDGVVTEVVTVIQEHARVEIELVISQDRNTDANLSSFKAELMYHVAAGEAGDGFTFHIRRNYSTINNPTISHVYMNSGFDRKYTDATNNGYSTYTVNVQPGESLSLVGNAFYSSFAGWKYDITRNQNEWNKYYGFHNIDGSFHCVAYQENSSSYDYQDPSLYERISTLSFGGCWNYLIYNLTIGGNETSYFDNGAFEALSANPLPIDRGTYPLTANNFTDEDTPAFSYALSSGKSVINDKYVDDIVMSVHAALSFDGVTADIPYREVSLTGSNYTFSLTDNEREILREKAQGSTSVPIYYLIKTNRQVTYSTSTLSADCISATQRIFTVVGAYPSLNPTVKDIKPETLALTGDENTFIRYESMAEYAINATASKHATIVSQFVQCGSKTITNLPQGIIDDVESGTFIFGVTDSRNMAAQGSVFKNLVEYVKPTCYQKTEIEISGETGANIKLTVSGNYFNGSFGAVDNTLKLEVRYTDDNGDMGAWKTISGTPTFNGTTYELEATYGGFNYGRAYVFQCRATDKLNFVESSQYTTRLLPVFDWSENDFNFNVPVNINAEDLTMHNKTIIRHSDDTNNTVLSASEGNIYIRPGGTNSTYGETIFYENGNVKFNGTVTFADGSIAGGDPLSVLGDYVIAIGEEAMGSNGTWYWRKWNSGKAEAWGCRNFGNMAVTTAWGSLYRGAILTQDLPNNVFIRTPDAININIVHSNYGGWICKHEQTAPSADTTGSFIFVRPASATVTPTNIGFYIVGEWK